MGTMMMWSAHAGCACRGVCVSGVHKLGSEWKKKNGFVRRPETSAPPNVAGQGARFRGLGLAQATGHAGLV
jgi:hypothetical protein